MLPETSATVERLLAEAWRGSVRLGEVEVLREDKCFRVRVAGAPEGSPPTVIVKVDREEIRGGETPSDRFLDEWAGLVFLNEAASGQGLVPKLYGGGLSPCLAIFEDFGKGESVASSLMGDDPERAREALALHAEAVADLHVATLGKESRYREIREGLAPKAEGSGGMGWSGLPHLRPELEKAFEAIGQRTTSAFWDEYELLTAAIDDPFPLWAYVHKDSCPDNTVLEPSRVRLIDFERGGYRACLLDAAYCRLGMPHCWLAQRLPDSVAPEAERRYRDRIARTVPEAKDDRFFGARMTEACAYWILDNGTWMVHRNLEKDFEWGPATWHQRVLMRLEQFARTTEEFSHLPEMGRAARETLRRLTWNVEPMPLYHAFRSPG